jgi:signal transduction histidine kinase/ActR/RegA family two-component response regulator
VVEKLTAMPPELLGGGIPDSAPAAERFGDICAEHMRVLPPPSDGEVEGREHAWRQVAAELAQKSRALRAEVERRRELEGERAGLVAATRRASSHLARLQRVTSALLGAQTMEDVGAVAVGTMAQVLRASDALLAVAAASGAALEPTASAGRLAAAAAGPFALDEKGPIARAWRTGRIEWLGPGEQGERLEAVVVLPLEAAGRRVGALAFGFDAPQSITPADRALLEDLRRQVALAVDRARLLETAVHERARAEDASRAKDEFLNMLGHELRNPLSPMVTVLQLLRTRGATVFTREHAVLERQVGHMVRLVDDLLDVARVARGRLELKRRPTNLREVVGAAMEAAGSLLEQAGHELAVELPERPLVVDADPERLAQVVTNLLTNAAKYTPPGGHLRVRAAVVGATARLEVQDDGRGIDAALLPRVFQLFVQGRRDLDRAEGGLGLGLALVQSIAELHGGRVEAQSDGPGRGSTFVVELPLMAQCYLPLPRPAAPRRPPAETGRRVLVVDDNTDAADALGEALRCFGHDVRVTHDAPAALQVARGFRPELALLDIGLPAMSGWELGERLRAVLGKSVRLVAVTGYGLDADRARSREAGFEAHLVKPVDLSLIESTVTQVLGLPGPGAAEESAPSR